MSYEVEELGSEVDAIGERLYEVEQQLQPNDERAIFDRLLVAYIRRGYSCTKYGARQLVKHAEEIVLERRLALGRLQVEG